MAIYSEFSHWKWWFSIVMLVYQRVLILSPHDYWSYWSSPYGWDESSMILAGAGLQGLHCCLAHACAYKLIIFAPHQGTITAHPVIFLAAALTSESSHAPSILPSFRNIGVGLRACLVLRFNHLFFSVLPSFLGWWKMMEQNSLICFRWVENT